MTILITLGSTHTFYKEARWLLHFSINYSAFNKTAVKDLYPLP